MIAWILGLWSWFSKLGWVTKILGFFPVIKQYWQYIVIGILVVFIGILYILLLSVKGTLLECKNAYEISNAIQEIKVQYITEYIDKEKVIYKDKIKVIKEYVYDGNKTECENALNVIRSTAL